MISQPLMMGVVAASNKLLAGSGILIREQSAFAVMFGTKSGTLNTTAQSAFAVMFGTKSGTLNTTSQNVYAVMEE